MLLLTGQLPVSRPVIISVLGHLRRKTNSGGAGGKGRHEVWDGETMFSQLVLYAFG